MLIGMIYTVCDSCTSGRSLHVELCCSVVW